MCIPLSIKINYLPVRFNILPLKIHFIFTCIPVYLTINTGGYSVSGGSTLCVGGYVCGEGVERGGGCYVDQFCKKNWNNETLTVSPLYVVW